MDPHFDWKPSRAAMLERIERFGWAAQGVLGDRSHPEYVYTVGLSNLGHPELVLLGMPVDDGLAELEALVPLILDGLRVGDLNELRQPCGCTIRFVPVRPGAIDLNVADGIHGSPVRAVQYVWSAFGRYPGEHGYDPVTYRQPLLGPAWWDTATGDV
jgi:hypothetical protein